MSESDLHQPVTRYLTRVDTMVRADQTVAESLARLRSRRIEHPVIYFYALDDSDRLVGVVPTRRLLLAPDAQYIREVMISNPVTIPSSANLEMALGMFAMHRLLALPVVDEEQRLLGIVDVKVYTDEAGDLFDAHRKTDLFQLIGLRLEGVRMGSPLNGFRQRMPWLSCNLVGGVACAMIAWYFEAALEAAVVLAIFIPLVLTVAESIAMQSMTLSLPLVHGSRVAWRAWAVRFGSELPTAALLSLGCGALVALVSLLWMPGIRVVWVLMVSIPCTMLAAATFGVAIPAALHSLRLDPKVASGPVVLMLTDMLTTAVYLGLASWFFAVW